MPDDRRGEVDFDPTHQDADLFDKLPALIVFGTLAAVILLGVMGFGSIAGLVAALGFIVVLPLSAILNDELRSLFGGSRDRNQVSHSSRAPSEADDALEELKRRYAAGELSETEFEERTEKLLENERLEDVQARVENGRERAPEDETFEFER
ncbi:SHOCT domain-containing protein [Haloarchaeobius amylolyticus]|uniref:SHOCT domain-containing protein n=1 Tax=Haloarchaeobius amylolyticus TaxID=1198296 RepID=UPI0022710F8B|nr:SHOCT domain-containing protein [Haloarchaeobius amylolyticus]